MGRTTARCRCRPLPLGAKPPIYLARLLIVGGEAGLFLPLPLLAYAGAMAVFYLFVISYEESALCRRFGTVYLEYQQAVPAGSPPAIPQVAAADRLPYGGTCHALVPGGQPNDSSPDRTVAGRSRPA